MIGKQEHFCRNALREVAHGWRHQRRRHNRGARRGKLELAPEGRKTGKAKPSLGRKMRSNSKVKRSAVDMAGK